MWLCSPDNDVLERMSDVVPVVGVDAKGHVPVHRDLDLLIHLVRIDVGFSSQGEGDLSVLGHNPGDVLFLAGKHPHFHLFAGYGVEVGDEDVDFVSPRVLRCVMQIDPSVSGGRGACGAVCRAFFW